MAFPNYNKDELVVNFHEYPLLIEHVAHYYPEGDEVPTDLQFDDLNPGQATCPATSATYECGVRISRILVSYNLTGSIGMIITSQCESLQIGPHKLYSTSPQYGPIEISEYTALGALYKMGIQKIMIVRDEPVII